MICTTNRANCFYKTKLRIVNSFLKRAFCQRKMSTLALILVKVRWFRIWGVVQIFVVAVRKKSGSRSEVRWGCPNGCSGYSMDFFGWHRLISASPVKVRIPLSKSSS